MLLRLTGTRRCLSLMIESVFKLSLIMNMIDNLSGPMAGVASKVGANVSKLDAASQTFGSMAKAGAAMQEMGSQIVNAVLAPVEATFETRRALGELASLGVQDLEAVENAARSFSDQWAGTSKADFISAAYDIKSGIASLSDEGVAEFTSLAALTAKATKSTAGEMTSLFATGYGIYKDYYSDLSDMEFGEMFSAGISDAVRAFKTSGSGMAQAIQNLGASATTAQVPLEEQLSVLGMLQATMGGAEAGTKYKAFLRSATKGGEALGLKFTDANNQLLSMPEILDILRGKFGETMDAAEKMELQKAFGDTEAVALIDLMYNKVGDLQDNIVNMYGSLGKGVSVTEQMASAIQETEPERFERLKQRIHNVTESIGNSLLPTVNDLMSKGEGVLTKVGSWIEKNQELVKVIMLIVLAVGGFLAVGGTLIALISGVGLVVTKTVSAFKILKGGFALARGALTPLISSVWSFTAALLANPVTWVVIGIVALIAALVLLWVSLWAGKRNYEAKVETRKYEHRYSYYSDEVLCSRDAAQERALFEYSDKITDRYYEYFKISSNIELKVLLNTRLVTKATRPPCIAVPVCAGVPIRSCRVPPCSVLTCFVCRRRVPSHRERCRRSFGC